MAYSVSQFVEFLNAAFASAVFPEGVEIEGEVAEYRVSQGKWIWFLLKDEEAVISCFATSWQLRTPLEDGMRVRVHGIPKIYGKSGKFSVTVERVEMVGEGALRRAFELLKKKLETEGVFAPERKRPLPRFPNRIGLIASQESAAYTDFLRIFSNRWGGTEIKLANVAVQGRDAVREICGAFDWFNHHPGEADVLVLTRGGGSLEDLQAFNSEDVARAVFGSRIPVIVAVGHERDESLADFAADVRASTPSNAAELIVPDRREIIAFVEGAVRTMDSSLRAALLAKINSVESLSTRIEVHAKQAISSFERLFQSFVSRFALFESRISSEIGSILATERLLKTLDPRRPLERGYAIVRAGGRLVRRAGAVDAGTVLDIQLAEGGLLAEVKSRK